MFSQKKILIILLLLLCIFAILLYFASEQARVLQRDPIVLMNRYYLLKQSNPEAAKKALQVILRNHESYLPALNELSQIYLKENNLHSALPLVKQLHELQPDDSHHSLQLAYIYYKIGEWDKAAPLLTRLKENQKQPYQDEATIILDKMSSSVAYYKSGATISLFNINQPPEPSLVNRMLLDYFYKLRQEQPEQAQKLLVTLNQMNPDNVIIQEELGYYALKEKNDKEAVLWFSRVYSEKPSPRIALQLAYLNMNLKNNLEASQYFLLATLSYVPEIKAAAFRGYELTRYQEPTLLSEQIAANNLIQPSAPENVVLLDQFYLLKKQNKEAAWSLITEIIKKYPNDVKALKEGGFLAIDKGYQAEAIRYFTQAYNLTYEPDLAMQLGYLYDQTPNKYIAYQYFKLATHSSDKTLELRAQNALTNLAGLQTKALPAPYFGEVFFDPFTQSRFGLTVRPLVARLGIERDNKLQSKVYLAFRQTDDNKSESLGQVPQIYEDNVRIMGVGLQITPIKLFPMVAFIEAGGAYDLFYRDRNRWRGDLRGGLMYYNEFGARPAYFDRLKFSTDYYSTLYGDATYFSRYDNNVIGTLKTHQGIRLIQYHSSMINLYITGRVIEDTNREFFNNIAEIGPGVSFTPSNRFPVQLRFEHINGVYLPAGGSVNPYGKYYTNNTVQLFSYVKF
ncbi:MAG TPA: tetratricopeptide repeat protein [Legionella sp.]|nr:tetratricopeptide repeat protein [Legionella sp.]